MHWNNAAELLLCVCVSLFCVLVLCLKARGLLECAAHSPFPCLFRYQQHSLALMEAYDPRRNVWLKLADMGSPCSGLGACALFGLLYTVGHTRSTQPTIKRFHFWATHSSADIKPFFFFKNFKKQNFLSWNYEEKDSVFSENGLNCEFRVKNSN